MRVVYLDTSALLKFYVTETGSQWIDNLLTVPRPAIAFTSQLTIVEATCAFARRVREGTLTITDQTRLLTLFERDVVYKYDLIDVLPLTIKTACQLANRHPLRAYDAIQLATGWLINQELQRVGRPPLTFITADDRLLNIAQAEDLGTANPNHFP